MIFNIVPQAQTKISKQLNVYLYKKFSFNEEKDRLRSCYKTSTRLNVHTAMCLPRKCRFYKLPHEKMSTHSHSIISGDIFWNDDGQVCIFISNFVPQLR